MITKSDYMAQAVALSKEANVLDGLHDYFVTRCSGLYKSLRQFALLESPIGDVLEIGPFYSYVPFVLQPRATSYTVLEGDDPAVYPLKPLYEKRGIGITFLDLFEMFGPTHSAGHALGFAERSFDSILCWETMEHFNFNPIKFVREMHRILKPGGKVYITVPNKASFQALFGLVFGRSEKHGIDSYYTFEDYCSNGKKAFYGFHWREYSSIELAYLFTRAGFTVQESGTFAVFNEATKGSLIRRAARGLSSVLSAALPRFGTHVYVIAKK